jgi:ketosteroid isomerase-like protein
MKKLIIWAALQAAVISISFYQCDAQQVKQSFNLQQVKEAIEKSNADYFNAFATGDSSLFIDRYTADCWIMPSNKQSLCGPEAPLDFFRVAYYRLGVRKGKFISIDIFGDGEGFVTEVGFYRLFDAKDIALGDGKYIVLWKKTPNGWKRFRDFLSPDGQDTDANVEEARNAIAASNALYFESFKKNDPSIFISSYAEDACILAPNAPQICGREGAAKFFRTAYDSYGLRGGKFITTAVYGDGAGYVVEEGLWQSINAKGALFDKGKFLVLWKKTPEGWKMFRDSFSADHEQDAKNGAQ